MVLKQLTKERRKANRAKRVISIQYRLAQSRSKEADTKWHISTTHDMSVLGLSFLSEALYEVEDILELNVIMSGILDIFEGHAQVVRVAKRDKDALYLVAVKFIPCSSAKKTAVKRK